MISARDAAWPVWVLLALPGVYWTWTYWQGARFYGEYLHATGWLSAQLLIATMAVTPLRVLWPRTTLTRWLLPHRRHLGVAAFAYAALHAGAYVLRHPWAAVAADAAAASMWTGWAAAIIMLAQAMTSTDAAMRLMKRGWKLLHRGVYAVAVLTFAHWILSAFDPTPGYVHLGILAALEAFRVAWPWMGAGRQRA